MTLRQKVARPAKGFVKPMTADLWKAPCQSTARRAGQTCRLRPARKCGAANKCLPFQLKKGSEKI